MGIPVCPNKPCGCSCSSDSQCCASFPSQLDIVVPNDFSSPAMGTSWPTPCAGCASLGGVTYTAPGNVNPWPRSEFADIGELHGGGLPAAPNLYVYKQPAFCSFLSVSGFSATVDLYIGARFRCDRGLSEVHNVCHVYGSILLFDPSSGLGITLWPYQPVAMTSNDCNSPTWSLNFNSPSFTGGPGPICNDGSHSPLIIRKH